MAYITVRGRNFRRSQRKRRDSSEEYIHLDYDKAPAENLRDILFHVVKREGVSKARKLGYLNCLVRLKARTDFMDLGFSLDEIICCLRVALFHEAAEVRAGGLRALRYLLKDQASVEALCRAHIHWFIVRSLDIILDNRIERVHALRLARKILCTCPRLFPKAVTNCLVAIANNGAEERDSLQRACLGTLCELVLLNPTLCRDCGVLSALLQSVLDCPHPQVSEAILGVTLSLINSPHSRAIMGSQLSIHHLMAPLTDAHYKHSPSESSSSLSCETENRTRICRFAIASVLHSWPGLLSFCDPSHCGVQTIVEMLYLPYKDLRREIMLLLYDVFSLPVPDWTDDFNTALLSADPSSSHDSWQLYEGFVAAEGKAILPHVAKYRANLVENYLALLLLVFINGHILEALVEVLTTGDDFISIHATILLGELLHMCSQLLPPDFNHHCQCLPTLIAMATSNEISSVQRNKANSAVSLLERFHVCKRRGPVPCSLFLDQLLQFTSPLSKRKDFFKTAISRARLHHCLKRESDSAVIQLIKDSQVLVRTFNDWDWELIGSILKSPGEVLKRLEDSVCRHFVSNLVDFFKPYSKNFSQLKISDFAMQEICTVGCHLIDFLLEADEVRAFELVGEFLSEMKRCFSEVTHLNETAANTETNKFYVQNSEDDVVSFRALLRPSTIVNTGQFYFLFIGRLSSSNKGRKWLEKAELFEHMLEMVGQSDNEIYIKLIASSLDYSTDGFSRTLLTKILTASNDICRLYATNYLHVLLRACVSDFRKWAIELLVTQLYDKSRAVSLAAVDILDEACELPENLEALIALRPSLLHIGDRGLLLILRFLSVSSGFTFLRDANFINHELKKWNTVNNLKYVKLVEESLNEAVTRHRRGNDGTYGRHSSNIRHKMCESFVPAHMYGQLAQHNSGLELLVEQECLASQYQRICTPCYSSDGSVLQLKAALWAVGHVGSTPLGLPLVQEAEVIPLIVNMAAQAPFISVRGVCFYVLGLLSSTPEGADVLAQFGWEGLRHNRHDRWPLVPQVEPLEWSQEETLAGRGHSWSISSMGSQFSDLLTRGLMRGPRRRDDSESSNPNAMDTVEEEEPYQGLERSRSFYNHEEGSSPRDRTFTTYKEYHDSPVGTGVNTLPRNIKFSPHHQLSVVDTRPRSSSDGRPEVRTNSIQEQGRFLSDSRDSGTGEDKIASEGSHGELVGAKEERSDSNESAITSTKSRSGSCTDSTTSGVSSCDSNPTRTPQVDHAQKLSPIPSSTSLNTLVSKGGTNSFSDLVKPTSFETVLPPLQRSSTLVQSPTSPLGFSALFSYTSARDALGYATLRAIQRRRTQSFGEKDEQVSPPFRRRNSKAVSLDPRIETTFFIGETGTPVSPTDDASRRSSLESQATSLFSRRVSENNLAEDIRYMGLCLPQDINMILRFPVDASEPPQQSIPVVTLNSNVDWQPHTSKGNQRRSTDGLELHEQATCLLRHSVPEMDVKGLSREGPKHKAQDSDEENNSVVNFRREVLHLVINLSSSIGNQQWEKGLLSLKQKFPSVFQDLCLYSELCLQMEEVRFRLAARRFLQEVFFDLNFEQLLVEAESIMNVQPLFVTLPRTEEAEA